MKFILLSLLSICLTVSSYGADCLRLFEIKNISLLTSDQRRAVEEAAQGDYKFEILKGSINNRDRVVVLMGESHIKTYEDKYRGKKVFRTFIYRGTEDFQTKNLLSGRASFNRIGPKPTESLPYISSINDSVIENVQLPTTKILEDMMVEHLVNSISSGEKTLEEIKQSLEGSIMSMMVSPEVLVQRITDGNLKTEPPKPQSFNLETGYKPSFKQHFASLVLSSGVSLKKMSVCSLVTATAGACMAAYGLISNNPDLLFLGVGSEIAASLFSISIGKLPDFYSAVKTRDKYMSQSIIKVFEGDEKIEQMIVTVGRAHLPGIKQLLEHVGFK